MTQLSMLTAVLDGHLDALRDEVLALPTGDDSPFAGVPGTHNGRFVVVSTDPSPTARRRAGGLPAPMLMCSAVIDRDPREWVRDLLGELGDRADSIWSHCAGWRDTTDPVEYLASHRVPPVLSFATWDAPVDRVRVALAGHATAKSLAVRAQHMTPDELVAAYRAEFA